MPSLVVYYSLLCKYFLKNQYIKVYFHLNAYTLMLLVQMVLFALVRYTELILCFFKFSFCVFVMYPVSNLSN